MRNYNQIALDYCKAVVSDTLPNRKTCRLEKLACQRHLNDLKRQDDPDFPYYFDELAGSKKCQFTEYLQHTKGKWRGDFLVLEPHQIFIDMCLFGWLKKKNDMRRFTRAYIAIPRKNGKSICASTAGLYMAFADNEQGAEVYAGATTEAQAQQVFEPAWQMVKQNPNLSEYFGLTLTGTPKNPTSIYRNEDMSRFMPVVGKPGDGTSPHMAVCDEYHEHATSVLYDTMDTGMGAREQPLLLVITTAGTNIASPCYELHIETIKMLEGTLKIDNLFGMIYTIDQEDNWEDFESWKKANPNYGISINEDYLRGKYLDALNNVSQRNILLTKHLNKWMNAGIAWMDMQKFGECVDTSLGIEQFKGCECWVSLDLASKIDLCAIIMLFKKEDKVVCFGRYYLPEETVNKKENQHYQNWVGQGRLIMTDGARTDFHRIEDDLKELSCEYNFKELAFDPKEASYLIQNIQEWANFECVEFPQSPALISEPMKELEAKIYAQEFVYDGCPVFTWMMGNVVKKQAKGGGNIKYYFPTKEINANKIDGPVAAIMALARLMTYEDSGCYNDRAKRGEEILRVL